jgi:AcrR family transcriptional regulator
VSEDRVVDLGAARRRSPRRSPDFDAVVGVACELLLAHGEGGFRIDELLERTSISKSSLYLHFGDRDGIIAKACIEIFARQVTRNIDAIIALMERCTTRDELLNSIELMIDAVIRQDDEVRWNRVMVMAAARHRPALWEELGKVQAAMNLAIAEQIEDLRRRGLMASTSDARELALFVQFATFGRIFRDLDPSMGNEGLESWRSMMVAMHRHFVLGDG